MDKKMLRKILLIAVPLLLVIGVTLGIVIGNSVKSNQYVTITYEVNGGSHVENKRYKKGTKVTLPETTKENRVFRGWYFDIEFTSKSDNEIVVENDITLYARFGINIILDANSGISEDSVLIDEDGKLNNLGIAYKDGYIFSGWFYEIHHR